MSSSSTLFSPIKIGKMEVRNRIAMAPITPNWSSDDGTVSEKLVDYLEARAAGGVGMIITETFVVDKDQQYLLSSMGFWDDSVIPNFKKLIDRVHAHGAKLVPQLSHPGADTFCWMFGGQPVAPSAHYSKTCCYMARELTVDEIKKIIRQYGDAARRAREAGFDAIELHAAHAYMLAGSFLSPLRNKRTDEYGGSNEGRLRFVLEVMEDIKKKAGKDFPVILRISGDEHTPGGRDVLNTQYIAPRLVEAGVDAFHVSGGIQPEQFYRIIPPTGTPFGLNVAAAAAVKQVVDVPVLTVARINDPRFADDILTRGLADMVVMGRALLADPELPNKAKEGRFEDIAPCTSCAIGCVQQIMKLQSMTCVINPTVGREVEMAIVPADKPKKVLVAGGGPGGMETARVAALRGHEVTLYEKQAKLGGQLNIACVAPMRQELAMWISYLSTQVKKLSVKVVIETEVTPDLIAAEKPDAVVVATGGECATPPIPGVDGPRVISSHAVLAGAPRPKGRVLVIGGGLVGCEVADLLADLGDGDAESGTAVTIIEMLPDIAMDEVEMSRMLLIPRLREKGVKWITSATVSELLEDGAIITRDGAEETIQGIDHIIIACGTSSVDTLSQNIEGVVPEVYVIGDAKQPRLALEAIAEGAEVGRKI
ncbi:MAG: FAD-dependent oxidoreductase [Chloroflexota bacterium]|nr:FAD-dependent oxidoreductase [Chloroflexota bacterium]